MSMSKKKIIFIIVLSIIAAALIIGGLYYYNYLREKKDIELLKTKTTEFVNAWGNFKNEGSPEYLDSIKPYLTSDLYAEYQESAQELNGMASEEYLPTESTFKIKGDISVVKKDKNYEATVTGTRNYIDVRQYEETVTIIWEKKGNTLLIKSLSAVEKK
jgi:hypothetical protein